MRITGYKPEDFSRIMEINDLCYSGVYRAPRSVVEGMTRVSDIFVAREDDPIGFAIVQNVDCPYLWNIAVLPTYRGQGVAGSLLREMIVKYTLTKEKKITLHVNVNNPAQKLYFNNGFRVIDVARKYFDPDDGLLMERRLP